MKLLIDGDLLVHRSTIAVEHDSKFDERFHILWSDPQSAWNILEDKLHDLTEISGVSEYLITFSDPTNNFRKHLGSMDYKSLRKKTRKPLAYWETIDRVKDNYETVTYDNIEADDTMGILMTQYPDEYILWTLDKDLKQIPGLHIKEEDVIKITPSEGEDFFFFQTLAGDQTDGYYGCEGIGDKRARDILDANEKVVPVPHTFKSGPRKGKQETRWVTQPCADPWEAIVSYYIKSGQTEADALYNAQMARILKHGEYKDGEPILWTP